VKKKIIFSLKHFFFHFLIKRYVQRTNENYQFYLPNDRGQRLAIQGTFQTITSAVNDAM